MKGIRQRASDFSGAERDLSSAAGQQTSDPLCALGDAAKLAGEK
jgi:hypothetical protein